MNKKIYHKGSISTVAGITIIIAVIALLFGGAFLYAYWAKSQSEIVVYPPLQPDTTSNQMAGWQTYTNSQYGFEVQYPPSSIKTQIVQGSIPFFNLKINNVNTLYLLSGGGNDRIEIYADKGNDAIANCTKFNFNKEIPSMNQIKQINGINFYTMSQNEAGAGSSWTTTEYSVINNNTCYAIFSIVADQSIQNVADSIISTFKFTDQTAGWSVYTDSKYGFTMSFPASWKGFTVTTGSWTANKIVSDSNVKDTYTGVKLIFKNPQSTAKQLYQDIPVMIISPDVWKLIMEQKINASGAAPIEPAKIGENSKYIFATPPRWYGFTDAIGYQDAVQIVGTFKAY